MNVSVIIPVYNEEKVLGQCLEALLNQTDPADEIIVVDNNCHDESMTIAKKYPVRIIKQTIQGMTPARNKGFDSAKYEILARCDADTRVTPQWIATIKRQFSEHPDMVGYTGPAWFYDMSIPKPVVIALFYFYGALVRIFIGHTVLFGANYALRSSVWQRVRETVCTDDKRVHEDVDLSINIAPYGRIMSDRSSAVGISGRRYRSASFYLEYPKRLFSTFRLYKKI